MKKILFLFILCLASISYSQSEEEQGDSSFYYIFPFDSTIYDYLDELRVVCSKKDTSELHHLIGDECFGWSCYGGEYPTRISESNWTVFKNHYRLINNPNESNFWDFFPSIIKNGIHFDSIYHEYRAPSFNYWGSSATSVYEGREGININVDRYSVIPLFEILTLYSSPDLNSDYTEISIPRYNINEDSTFQYKLNYSNIVNNEFYELQLDNKTKGFIPMKEVIWWNYHFEFKKNDESGKWYINYYEVCDY